MLELEAARNRILATIPPLPAEAISISEAAGRVLAASLTAPADLPRFDNSAMDGFAVRAEDLTAASAMCPVDLQLIGQIVAGDTAGNLSVNAGTCVRVFTGSPLPAGADAVVMQEDTRRTLGVPSLVQVLDPVVAGENVRRRGEDVARGKPVLAAGDVLRPGAIALLAALGFGELQSHRRPVVGLIATGNELVELGQPLGDGQIYESNRAALVPMVTSAGAVPRLFALVPDTLAATRNALEEVFKSCDVVVTSGGVSVGDMDFVKPAFESIGGTLEFWRVAIKPGRPFVFGRCGGKFLFGLPGNPVSALVTFQLLVRPALRKMLGDRDTGVPSFPAVLAEPLVNPGDRRHFVRATVDDAGAARLAGAQASHRLGALPRVNGLIDVPAHANWPAGTPVRVFRFE